MNDGYAQSPNGYDRQFFGGNPSMMRSRSGSSSTSHLLVPCLLVFHVDMPRTPIK